MLLFGGDQGRKLEKEPVGGTGKTGGTEIHDDKKGRGKQLYGTRNIHLFIHPPSMPYINRRTAT